LRPERPREYPAVPRARAPLRAQRPAPPGGPHLLHRLPGGAGPPQRLLHRRHAAASDDRLHPRRRPDRGDDGEPAGRAGQAGLTISRMRILVHGAGAVGGYFGALLARGGHDVTFVARGANLDALRRDGLTVRLDGDSLRLAPVRAIADPREATPPELVLVCVKSYD